MENQLTPNNSMILEIRELLENARKNVAQQVNTQLLTTYWNIGRIIVEYEQQNQIRADYGKQTLKELSKELTREFGKGFSRSNLQNMRAFYLAYEKCQTVSGKLSWSHYCELLSITDENKRSFYEKESVNSGWSVRELKRQIDSSLYERLLLSSEDTPRKKSIVQPEPPKVNLLVDIQAKLQAGKGAGYARWAKVFNLKQMAQTVNFLTEHHLLDYAELAEKAAAATAHHNELSAQIKAAEKRMAEIAVLRTHIVNYAKTRETYVAYRKAGYSKKFREEHEEEILLHQAAKNAFDEMGVKKLPKVKDLQAEYAKLLEEKKKTYAEYRRSREEMRELLTAKANVDRLLKMDEEQKKEQEKDHGQR